ncbi:sugar ABC transporter ATP-binding protein [Clostridium sp. AM58-1XD]|uniref:sugar ABC transporter ATP-binding protein n=1 Tax=Clostridium sp. AM58-1XD TaxID=2292307 RepID=UPI000E4DDC7C|nr:sugar ABC transporter ATP-binding protein [Clostridium sp. AM58-1XD]RGY98596.1 sugar ABC transporter ATP-binding protein [Clostridium sp. AM58-1XD]
MADTETIVELHNIHKEFLGVTALNHVDLSVKAGMVHALLGENGAGKSTLMKIICGIYSLEKGEYHFKGREIRNLTPAEGLKMGVSMIQQELSPVLELTVAENIFLGREPLTKFGMVDYKKMEEDTEILIQDMGGRFRAKSKMAALTVADMQMVEMVKAVSRDAALVIMDEPTSSLSDSEIEILFREIGRLKEKGIGIIYITHKLDEVFQIADEITVMRDGEKISTGPKCSYTMERIITEMVGRELTNVYPKMDSAIGDIMLETKNLSKKGAFEDISFYARRGEILGFSGLVGAGRTEIMRTIFGLDLRDSGTVYLDGEEINIRHPGDAINRGVALASEDRKMEGLVLCRSIRENVMLPNMDQIIERGLLNRKRELSLVKSMTDKMKVKMASAEQNVSNLSGGNQQKVVLAKWLLHDLKVMILDEPTRGIDVGAKYEIYKMIGEMAKEGLAVIVISSEIPELLGICDRIYVMSQGKLTGEFTREEATQEKIMHCAIANYLL